MSGQAGTRTAATGAAEPPGQAAREQDAPPRGWISWISWRRRPLRTSALFAAANAGFWVLASRPLPGLSVLALLLALLVVMATASDTARSGSADARAGGTRTARREAMEPARDGRSGPGPQLGGSLKLLLQETSAFKRQNPGKFCLLVCSLCAALALLGRHLPGAVASYLLVLALFLWPLVSSQDVAPWLRPALRKLDFGVGELLQKIKENHERRLSQAQREQENLESDLSSMCPQLDSAVFRDMSVSDTEASDPTWTDSAAPFSLSEGHTPQTEDSEDLDREDAFTGCLSEFPSLDNGTTTNGDEDEEHSFGFASPPPQPEEPEALTLPPAPGGDQPAHRALEVAGDVIAAAVAAAIQGRIEAALGPAAAGPAEASRLPGCSRPLEPAEESDSEVEDFELLDQSELDRLEGELGQGEGPAQAQEAVLAPAGASGFLSKLLRRH